MNGAHYKGERTTTPGADIFSTGENVQAESCVSLTLAYTYCGWYAFTGALDRGRNQ
jgi:hypothetical protein